MTWVRHDLYVKLLRDDEQWMKLLEQQKAEAFKLAGEAAAVREQSLLSELNSSRSEAERLMAEAIVVNQKLQDDQDLQIRTTALTHAVHLASVGGTTHVPTEAKAMENFLRGGAAVEADEIKLINSGWNSLIEYLLQGETMGSIDATYIASLRREG
jgi:hypothetical protein